MIAVVTGGNRGIGLEVTKQLAQLGHTVILGSRSLEKGLVIAQQNKLPENIIVQQLDITEQDSIDTLKAYILNQFGRLDILINNAGINYDTWHTALDADLENVQETLETNLFGAWRMIQTFVPLMQQNNYGRIVNVSSGAGAIQGMSSGTPGYAISKTALNVLTIKIAALVKNSNILVNAVCPGWVRTDMGGASASRSVEKGAGTIIWAAELPTGSKSGKFFRDKKEISF